VKVFLATSKTQAEKIKVCLLCCVWGVLVGEWVDGCVYVRESTCVSECVRNGSSFYLEAGF
jgi:hypothetical protein